MDYYLPDDLARLEAAARRGDVAEVERLADRVLVHARFRATVKRAPFTRRAIAAELPTKELAR